MYQLDCIQFMLDSSKKMSKPSALYVYQQTLGLLLAGSQQAPMASLPAFQQLSTVV